MGRDAVAGWACEAYSYEGLRYVALAYFPCGTLGFTQGGFASALDALRAARRETEFCGGRLEVRSASYSQWVRWANTRRISALGPVVLGSEAEDLNPEEPPGLRNDL